MLFADLVKAFGSVPQDMLWALLAKMSVPPHLIYVIKRMNVNLKATCDLSGKPVKVPCTVGVKQSRQLSSTLFFFAIQACLKLLWYRTNKPAEGQRGGKGFGADWTNLAEFEFSF